MVFAKIVELFRFTDGEEIIILPCSATAQNIDKLGDQQVPLQLLAATCDVAVIHVIPSLLKHKEVVELVGQAQNNPNSELQHIDNNPIELGILLVVHVVPSGLVIIELVLAEYAHAQNNFSSGLQHTCAQFCAGVVLVTHVVPSDEVITCFPEAPD